MIVGVLKESSLGEKQVALIPAHVPNLLKLGLEVMMEAGAGQAAGFPDAQYLEKGVKIVNSREELLKASTIVLQVRELIGNEETGKTALALMREGQILIGFIKPYESKAIVMEMVKQKTISFAMELMPRITRAQSMDALSSTATVAGYKAVIMAADTLPKMFPMFMTAAGTISPAKVLVIGAGVAGLQAIATARRLGGVVQAYDIRPAVKEQVQSLGAKFVELELDTGAAEDKGGYAKAMDESFYQKQRDLMGRVVADSDVVIATAFVPGKKAPVLITADMVKQMRPGSVIVDLAASQGGNCELTQPGETVSQHDVTILGPTNLASEVPKDASLMYSKNLVNFLALLVKKGELVMNLEDEIIRDSMVTKDGTITNQKVKEVLNP